MPVSLSPLSGGGGGSGGGKKLPYTRYDLVGNHRLAYDAAPEAGAGGTVDGAAWHSFWVRIDAAREESRRITTPLRVVLTVLATILIGFDVYMTFRYLPSHYSNGDGYRWRHLLLKLSTLSGICVLLFWRQNLRSLEFQKIRTICFDSNLEPYHVEARYEIHNHVNQGSSVEGCCVYIFQPSDSTADASTTASAALNQDMDALPASSPGMLHQHGYLRVDITLRGIVHTQSPSLLMSNYDYLPQGFEMLGSDWTDFWSKIDALLGVQVMVFRRLMYIIIFNTVFVSAMPYIPTSTESQMNDEWNVASSLLLVLCILMIPLACVGFHYLGRLRSVEQEVMHVVNEFQTKFEPHGVAVEYRKEIQFAFSWWSYPSMHRYIYLLHYLPQNTTSINLDDESRVAV